jgi:hypothetical protein
MIGEVQSDRQAQIPIEADVLAEYADAALDAAIQPSWSVSFC